MDDATFDRLTRALGVSRRGALRVMAGGAVAKIAAIAGHGSAVAKPRSTKKDDPFYRAKKSCRNGEQCGALAPCTQGVCIPSHCRIGDEIYRNGAPNPENPCESCRSTAQRGAWQRWGDRPDGAACPDIAGECVLERYVDGTSCGEQQICCAGICCEVGLSCGPNGVCHPFASDPGDGEDGDEPGEPEEEEDDDPPSGDPDPCPGGEDEDCEGEEPVCIIGGVAHANGARNPERDCAFCDAEVRPAGWTFVADNTACGEALDRYCCQGNCCTPTNCCNHVGLCTAMADFACPELVQ